MALALIIKALVDLAAAIPALERIINAAAMGLRAHRAAHRKAWKDEMVRGAIADALRNS